MSSSADLQELYRQEQVSFEFLVRHKHDFNNCAANINLIKDYFQEHHLDWTSENLEKAFAELRPRLAPAQGAPKNVPASPSVATTPPPPPVPAPPVQPAVEPTTLTMEQINSWDGPTMRKKMADPAVRRQIDAVLATESKLQRLARHQDERQRAREN